MYVASKANVTISPTQKSFGTSGRHRCRCSNPLNGGLLALHDDYYDMYAVIREIGP
jgi:hypothetical protein